MIVRIMSFVPLLLILGCAPRPQPVSHTLPHTYGVTTAYDDLEGWADEEFDQLLKLFQRNCSAKKTQEFYGELCEKSLEVSDPKQFFETSLSLYKLTSTAPQEEQIMTGYYEPLLSGSLRQSKRYRYPVYEVPKDLITVELGSLYPELNGLRLRGRLEGKKLLPYASRAEMKGIDNSVICWVDDNIALYFLEVQGSGRILLDTNETIFIGYANQNGHPYRSLGKYLVQNGEIDAEDISLQSIRAWFEANPDRVTETLELNPSYVFFQQRSKPATGSLGLELTPGRSIAVDRQYIPMGSMMFMRSMDPETSKPLKKVVFAQDTGGAIRGSVRADYFWGFGDDAQRKAGKMKEPLSLWIFIPKEK